jgi:hypothetical protein
MIPVVHVRAMIHSSNLSRKKFQQSRTEKDGPSRKIVRKAKEQNIYKRIRRLPGPSHTPRDSTLTATFSKNCWAAVPNYQ